MFTTELSTSDYSITSPPSSPRSSNLSNVLQFQYDLCQIFMQKTGEQLHQREAELMTQTQDLLKSIQRRQSEKEGYSSTDSGSQEIQTSKHQDPNNFLTFKRAEGLSWKKIENKLAPCLSQIEEKCSIISSAIVRSTIADYRTLVQRWWQIETRQGMMERKAQHYQRQHQQNLILKQKLESQRLKLQSLERDLICQKQKSEGILLYANRKLQEMADSQRYIDINSKVYRDIKSYLDEKEKNSAKRLIQAQKLEQNLLDKIPNTIPGSCDNCCTILRRLKESLVQFKRYLQNEGNQLEGFYNKYRKTMFSQRTPLQF